MNDFRVVEVRRTGDNPQKTEELIKNCFKAAEDGWKLQEIRQQSYEDPSPNGTKTFIGWLLILTK